MRWWHSSLILEPFPLNRAFSPYLVGEGLLATPCTRFQKPKRRPPALLRADAFLLVQGQTTGNAPERN